MSRSESGHNIFIVGFPTTGKSQTARKVAVLLGWDWLDTDAEIVRLTGKSIETIFAEDGEEQFRKLERRVLKTASSKNDTVIATGGGIVVDPDNRGLMHDNGMVVCLEARTDTVYCRLQKDAARGVHLRPLLAVPDPLERIEEIKRTRASFYAAADWTVHTDDLSLEEVALEVVRGWKYWSRDVMRCGSDALATVVTTATQSYPVFVGWGLLEGLGEKMTRMGLSGTAFVIADETVSEIYGTRTKRSLEEAGFRTHSLSLPSGETAKTLDSASAIYDFLVQHRAERNDVIVAFGGGVVGDVAGFVAATFLRGIALIQVPTTLVGMTDSSIGGKVAVDHPMGKNLVGSFYQPELVLADVQLLTTLPRRELTAGWVETIKHGLILDADLFRFMDVQADALLGMDPQFVERAVVWSAAVKAWVVSEDERETGGRRTLLNYGHTIGHGIEAATGFERFLHGEAIAIGMMGAASLSQRLGLIDAEVVEEQRRVLEKFCLPVTCHDVDRDAVLKAMQLDKKVKDKAIRWVLLDELGEAVVRSDVSVTDVADVLGELGVG